MQKKKLLLIALVVIIAAVIITCLLAKPQQKTAGQCSLAVSMQTVLDNEEVLQSLSDDKKALIPENGYIIPESTIDFYENETVLDLIKRYARDNKIHIDIADNSYINGIGNFYGGDCGDLSGWLFFINGECASVGADQTTVQEGDKIEFKYTCDMGADLGLEW